MYYNNKAKHGWLMLPSTAFEMHETSKEIKEATIQEKLWYENSISIAILGLTIFIISDILRSK